LVQPLYLSILAHLQADAGVERQRSQRRKRTPIVKQLPEHAKKDDERIGEDERAPFVLCHYTVFNVEQCDGLMIPQIDWPTTPPEIDEDEICEGIVTGWENRPALHLTSTSEYRAYYRPATDSVHMPARCRFVDAPHYYSTLFHELVHSTGHESRLNRTFGDHFGDELYICGRDRGSFCQRYPRRVAAARRGWCSVVGTCGGGVMQTLLRILERAGGYWPSLYLKIENPPYMALVIEATPELGPLGLPAVFVAHCGEMNGDLMRDPEICFELSERSSGSLALDPYYWRNDYMGSEQWSRELVNGQYVVLLDLHRRHELFAAVWDGNLKSQGFAEAFTDMSIRG
jgi:hypothetical protein